MPEKIIYSHDNDQLLEKLGGVMMHLFSDGPSIKSASSDAFSEDFMRRFTPPDSHFGMHLNAMGAGESYAFNKNGDWWGRKPLQDRHDTFVKFGAYYEEHKNRDREKRRGDVKSSAFNAPMDRVELIVWGDKRKAEEDYEMVKAGKSLSFSMSAKVPHDVCSCCGHKAASSKKYCDHARFHMTRYLPEFQKFAYVENPDPTFFDISRVKDPADRIAWYLNYLPEAEMQKAASINNDIPMSGFDLANVFGVNLGGDLGWSTLKGRLVMEKLSKAEQRDDAEAREWRTNVTPFAMAPGALTKEALQSLRRVEPDVMFHLLTKQSALLPFQDFLAYVTDQDPADVAESAIYKLASEKYLPGIFTHLSSLPAVPEVETGMAPASLIKTSSCCGKGDPIEHLLSTVGDQLSLDQDKVRVRVMRICVRPQPQMFKFAGVGTEQEHSLARSYAALYGIYKVAQLTSDDWEEDIDDPGQQLLICQH